MNQQFTKKLVTSWFCKNADISVRSVGLDKQNIHVFYIDCMIDNVYLSQNVISNLLNINSADFETIKSKLSASEIIELNTKQQVVDSILNGFAVIILDNHPTALAIGATGYTTRTISEPPTSQVTKGPREGFVEDLSINLSMLRRKIKSADFAVENLVIGKQTKTKIAVVYLNNIAEKSLVNKLTKQLKQINISTERWKSICLLFYLSYLLEFRF